MTMPRLRLGGFAVACLALICTAAYQQRRSPSLFSDVDDATCEDEVAGLSAGSAEEPTSLFQSFAHVARRQTSNESRRQLQHSVATALPSHSTDEGINGASASHSRAHATSQSPPALGPCSMRHFASLDLLTMNQNLQVLGMLPHAPVCHWPASAATPPPEADDAVLLQVDSELVKPKIIDAGANLVAIYPILYMVLFALMLVRMYWNMVSPDPTRMYVRPGGMIQKLRRPEAESWKRGYFSWLYVDWVDEWISRWGCMDGGSSTAIKVEQLDALGDEEDECSTCYQRFVRLWNDEVDRVGLQQARIILVIARFVSLRKIVAVMLWTCLYEGVMYLGPPLAMSWVIRYVEGVYIHGLQGVEPPSGFDLLPPSSVAIALFTGLPLLMSLSNSCSTMMSARIGVRVCGAMSSLAFRKAQRLPLRSLDTGEKSHDGWLQDMRRREHAVEDRPEDARSVRGGAATLVVESQEPTKFNLVQLIASDINTNIAQVPLMCARAAIMIPIVAILFGMLFTRISSTVWLCLVACIGVTGIITCYAGSQLSYMMAFYHHSGLRLQFLEDILSSIRTVKACGWEAVAEERTAALRRKELAALRGFYWKAGWMYCWFYQFPKIMIFITLWGYVWLFGREQSSNIFEVLPILYTFQSAVMSLMYTLPLLIAARPSLQRVERFMKQPEAPSGSPRSQTAPIWISMWPRSLGTTHVPPTSLLVQGSFCWRPGERPALCDLDINVPKGSSIAVVGQVGSGKSALLLAILGELFPVDDARICIPSRIAYSSQTPYICEGSLKENIVFGEFFKEDRYRESVSVAGLLPDLEALPGGDQAPVGSRGVSLSSGQRTRVSLARVAYAAQSTVELVLIDEAFGSGNAGPSGDRRQLLDDYISSTCLKGCTKVVVCQPDPESLKGFDYVVVMDCGRVVVQGSPIEVMHTPEFRDLLGTSPANASRAAGTNVAGGAAAGTASASSRGGSSRCTSTSASSASSRAPSSNHPAPQEPRPVEDESIQLRDDEVEGRADWDTLTYFCSKGGWVNLGLNMFFFLAMNISGLFCGIVLQRWSSRSALHKAGQLSESPMANRYLVPYVTWWGMCVLCWWLCWIFGIRFTLSLSKECCGDAVRRMLAAPLDKFFDKTPVGRIMNRMSTDLMNIDVYTYNQITMLIGHFWTNLVPTLYLHFMMPLYFTLAAIPLYAMLYQLVRRFWTTLVPMRYLMHVSKSTMDTMLMEVDTSNGYVRAAQKTDYRFAQFQELMGNQIKTEIVTSTFLKRWLVNRLFLMLSFLVTGVVLLSIWTPGMLSVGAVGLLLTNLFSLLVDVDGFVDSAMQAQFQIISMNRVHDYTKLPKERESVLDTDAELRNYVIKIRRKNVGSVRSKHTADSVTILRRIPGGSQADRVLLAKRDGVQGFVAPEDGNLQELDPLCGELATLGPRHCIVGVNDCHRDVEQMAKELCVGNGWEIKLHIVSDWLVEGAELVVEDLRVGYGDIPRDILQDVNFIAAPCSKVAIVGMPGSGKSTLLLSLLRLLEPRGGTILINGMDTSTVGLQTLRAAFGLVPQDPILMRTTMRENIDPFGQFEDALIWEALRIVQLETVIKGLPGGLGFQAQASCSRLSLGQRQLLHLARMIICQPAIILLDEATSRIDPNTEEIIRRTTEFSFLNSTLLSVTHRVETVQDFDLVVVLDSGRVAERGSPEDLREAKGGLFAQMLEGRSQ